MRDLVIAAVRQLAGTWQQEVQQRRRVSTVDPIADATEYRASELLAVLKEVDTATRMLTVEQFAQEHGRTASTVRRWCMHGELEALKNPAGDWEIPRNARRIKKAS
jgi:cupin superfamily acireductone dioxygenase involved in methionine salvage